MKSIERIYFPNGYRPIYNKTWWGYVSQLVRSQNVTQTLPLFVKYVRTPPEFTVIVKDHKSVNIIDRKLCIVKELDTRSSVLFGFSTKEGLVKIVGQGSEVLVIQIKNNFYGSKYFTKRIKLWNYAFWKGAVARRTTSTVFRCIVVACYDRLLFWNIIPPEVCLLFSNTEVQEKSVEIFADDTRSYKSHDNFHVHGDLNTLELWAERQRIVGIPKVDFILCLASWDTIIAEYHKWTQIWIRSGVVESVPSELDSCYCSILI